MATQISRSNACRLLSLGPTEGHSVQKYTPHNRTTSRRYTPRDSNRQLRHFGKSIPESGETHSSVLGCEKRLVSASIMSRSCFASIPVCVYKFSRHYLNNIIFIHNSLWPLATESPCTFRTAQYVGSYYMRQGGRCELLCIKWRFYVSASANERGTYTVMYEGFQSNFSLNRWNWNEVNSKRETCPVQNRTRMIGESAGLLKRKRITIRMRHVQDVVMETGCEKQLTVTVLPPKRMSARCQF